MAQDSTSRKLDQYIVRFPDGMRDELKELAKEHNRSLNAEIIARLAEFEAMEARFNATVTQNQQIQAELDRLRKIEKRYNAIKYRFVEDNGELKPLLTVPMDLHLRIREAARRTHRSSDAEATAALEQAYPPPRMSPFSDLELRIFQWDDEEWHLVDLDAWQRFRAGDMPPEITKRMKDDKNYFVVAVIDEANILCNIITHNYILKNNIYVSAAFDILNEDEIGEYNRFMTAPSHSQADEVRLRELRTKMEPAFQLPRSSIPKLTTVLEGISPTRVVRNVLRSRGIVTR